MPKDASTRPSAQATRERRLERQRDTTDDLRAFVDTDRRRGPERVDGPV